MYMEKGLDTEIRREAAAGFRQKQLISAAINEGNRADLLLNITN